MVSLSVNTLVYLLKQTCAMRKKNLKKLLLLQLQEDFEGDRMILNIVNGKCELSTQSVHGKSVCQYTSLPEYYQLVFEQQVSKSLNKDGKSCWSW